MQGSIKYNGLTLNDFARSAMMGFKMDAEAEFDATCVRTEDKIVTTNSMTTGSALIVANCSPIHCDNPDLFEPSAKAKPPPAKCH